MKAIFPGAIEDLSYHNDMLAAVGGDQLKLFSIQVDAQYHQEKRVWTQVGPGLSEAA